MKKSIFALLLILITAAANATTYYVATNGNDSNPGTITQPWLTWQKGFSTISAGDILYIRGGNYTSMYDSGHGVKISSRSGNSSARITVMAYPGEIPVLDCASLSSSSGVNWGILFSSCNYWIIKGVTVKNVREYNNLSKSSSGSSPVDGWELSNCSNITLEQCIVTNCGNGFSLNGTVTDIKYINCDSYGNYDYYDNGGLANGFNGNVRGSSTISYEGCRAWANSDDGWDNYGGSGYMIYKNCWAFRNGKDNPTNGNGDGFKLGYDASFTELPNNQRTLYNCISADNKLMGFDEGMDQPTGTDMALYNCIAYKNTNDFGFRFYKTEGTAITTLRNNISFGNGINYQGRSRNISDHNTWDAGAPAVNDADFASIDMTQMKRPRKPDGSLPDIEFSHLASGSDLIDAGANAGLPFAGAAPDLGAFESAIATVPAPAPAPVILAYQSSSVKNSNSSQVEVIYNLSVSTSVIPSATAFDVKVNSVSRSVSSLAVSDKNVYLTLSSPVKYGETVTLSYTKPSTNPLQCTSGTQAESISAKSVVNSVLAPVPVYVSSAVDNDTPNKIEMVYNDNLSSAFVPAVTAFAATVNGSLKVVQSITISGNNVILTLPANLTSRDTVKIAYTQPATNPLQTTSGAKAETIGSKPVTNNILGVTTEVEPVINNGILIIYPSPAREYISVANFKENSATAVLRLTDLAGKVFQETKLENITDTTKIPINITKPGFYIAQIADGPSVLYVQKLIVAK
ncbi:MAG: SwmB domain-containing protein [Chloroflexota bacterium]